MRRRPVKSTFWDIDMLAVLLWAALHDRPMRWATRRVNRPLHDRVCALPSNATMSRRLRDPAPTDGYGINRRIRLDEKARQPVGLGSRTTTAQSE